MGGSTRACSFIRSIDMTKTTTKTTVPATTTTKTTITKAALKKMTAEKKRQSKANMSAAGKKKAADMKKKGLGIFAPKTLSPDLAAICGAKSLPRTEVTKKIWVYIKKNQLNNGRIIKPDATLKKIIPAASIDMLKMASFVGKHLS